jgi:hypothetical protein
MTRVIINAVFDNQQETENIWTQNKI